MPKKEGCLFRLCDFETFNKGGKMKKCKALLSLTIGLAIGLGFVGKANATDYDDVDFTLRATGAGTAKWVQSDSINAELTASPGVGNEDWSIELENTAAASYSAFDFVPTETITLADFQTDITAASPEYSFRYCTEFAGNGEQFELTFEEVDGTGWLEVTAVGLQVGAGTKDGSWALEILATTTPFGFGGNTPDGSSVFEWSPLTGLDSILATVNAAWDAAESGAVATNYVLTLVQVELYENEAKVYYVDDIKVNGETYFVDDPVINITESPEETFSTIQGAIDVATAGDTIQVPSGTYKEDLKIDEEVTLTGVAADGADNWTALTAGAGGTGPTITYDGSTAHMIAIDADNVIFQGFTIDMTNSSASRGIHFKSTGAGTIDSSTILYNTFLQAGGDRCINISDDRIVNNFTINYNVFTGHATTAGNWLAITHNGGCSGANVASYNTMTGNNGAPLMLGTRDIMDITFSHNTQAQPLVFYEEGSDGGDFGDIVITYNTFSGYGLDFLSSLEDADFEGGAFDALDVIVRYNNFTGADFTGSEKAIYFDVATPTEYLDAKYNWWGNVTGPKNATSNPAGTGSPVDDSVTYVPWLDAEYPGGGATGGIPTELTIKASATSVLVGAVVTIKDTLKDVHGNPVYNKRIDYSVDGVGTVSPVFDTTTGYGYVTTDFAAGTHTGTGTVRAELSSDPSICATVDIVVAHGPVAKVVTTPASDTVVVLEDVTIVAELQDAYDNHIDADTSMIDFTSSGAGIIGIKSVTAGKIQIVYTTDTTKTMPSFDEITAADSGGVDTDISSIYTVGDIVDGDSSKIVWPSGDELVVSDDSTSIPFNVLAKDKYGNTTGNREITFEVSYGTVDSVDTTNVNGVFAVNLEYYGGTEAQVVTLTADASDGAATVDTTIYLEADTGCAQIDSIAITAGFNTISAGQEETLTFTYFDEFGNPVNILYDTPPDTTFDNLVAGAGSLVGAALVDTINTDTTILHRELVYGVRLTKLYTGNPALTETAVDTIVATAGAAADTFLMTVVPTGEAAYFTVEASAETLTVNNAVTLTITAFDADSNQIYTYGEDTIPITLSHTGTADTSMWSGTGVVDNDDGIGTVYDTMFTNGRHTVQLTNRKAETLKAIATAGGTVTGESPNITWTPVASLDHYGVVVQTDPIYGNFEFTITVNPCDVYGNVTTDGLPRVIKFQSNETGVTLSGDPLPCDRILEGPTDYTDMIADHATNSLVITVADYATPAIIGCSDTITVRGERDVGPTIVLFPPDTVYIDSTYNVIVRCENFGDEGESPKVECIITGEGYTYADTQYAILPFGGTDDVTFADWTVPPDANTFTITVVTLLSSDVNPGNDTLIAQIVSRTYGVEEDRVTIPTRFEFLSIFPNPVTKNAKITYAIPVKSRIDMKIYDITGKLVTTLKNGVIEEPGYKVANWNMTDARGKKVNSGIYFCNLEMNKKSSTKKILVIK